MKNKITADELSAQITDLLKNNRSLEAIDICTGILEQKDHSELHPTAMLMRSYCFMAEGETELAVSEHTAALEAVGELLPIEQLGIAEDAHSANLPYGYCAGLFADAAESILRSGDDPALAAGAYNKAGICRFREGSSTADEKVYFLRALDAMNENTDNNSLDPDHQEVLTALIKSNLAECLVREGDRKQAKDLYGEASDIFSSRLDDDISICLTHYAICQRCLSDLYRSEGENIRAHTCLSNSISELARRRSSLPDQLRMHLAVCYNARGTLRFQMGDYEGEINDCTQSLALREDMEDDPYSVATVLSNRAEAYTMLERFELAQQDFLRAVELFDSIEGSGQAAASAATRMCSLGMLYSDEEMYPEARSAYRSAADRIAALRRSGLPTDDYTTEQLMDIESLCRMRLSAVIARLEERDYYEALSESREAIRLLELLPPSVEHSARLTALHISNGELLEMFDELEAAKAEYELAESCRNEGIAMALSRIEGHDGEEYEEEPFEYEGSIWEDFSGNAPQG